MESNRGTGEDHVSTYVETATQAARRGDVKGLELSLAKLRLVAPGVVAEVSDKLYTLAQCVRAHPSFGPAQTQQPPASATG